jgi:hypothetical protein
MRLRAPCGPAATKADVPKDSPRQVGLGATVLRQDARQRQLAHLDRLPPQVQVEGCGSFRRQVRREAEEEWGKYGTSVSA